MKRIDQIQEINNTKLIAGPQNILKQSIRPLHDNFSGIRVLVYNPKLGGNEKYIFTIQDEKGSVLREQTVSESNAGWEELLRYDFSPIAASKGKELYFVISPTAVNTAEGSRIALMNRHRALKEGNAPEGNEADYIEKNYMSYGYSGHDVYLQGSAFLNETKLSGDLVFQTFYQTSVSAFTKYALTDFASRIKKDPGFIIFYLLFIIGCILFLTIRLKSQLKN